MAEFETTTPAAPALELAPLPNTFWVHLAGDPAGPGLPLVNDTQKAFSTVTAAVGAATAAQAARFLCVQGDYSGGYGGSGVDTSDLPEVTFIGLGGQGWTRADPVYLPPLLGGEAQTLLLVLENVRVFADTGTATSLDGFGDVVATRCFFDGFIGIEKPLIATQCTFAQSLTSTGAGDFQPACLFELCDIAAVEGIQCDFSTPDARIDEWSLGRFGTGADETVGGVRRLDDDPFWFVGGERERCVILRTADRTVNDAGTWDTQRAWVSENSLDLDVVLTVDMTDAPALALFTVENYDAESGFTLTVNGTAVAGRTRVVFQNVAGVLTPFWSEVL